MPWARKSDRGAAVVDFALIMVLLIPLVLGIIQVGIVLHVRNTMAAAASEGARRAASLDGNPAEGSALAQRIISDAVSSRYATKVTAHDALVVGVPGVVVRARAEVPALGLWGPTMSIDVTGHAVKEVLP
ncbi:MAG: pilus assembly protein TadE [Nocardioidaceae bacterium]|nr:pilus assembly protein TadE [Nocardioidaceae bacterium]